MRPRSPDADNSGNDDEEVGDVYREDPGVESLYELVVGRKPERYSTDPAVWLKSHRMTQTEVALRLARFLVGSDFIASDVAVALTGHELSRAEGPRFPVERFLSQRGWVRPDEEPNWRGAYHADGARFALVLHSKPRVGDLVTTLISGRRLVVHLTGGLLEPTRSPNERNMLCRVLGRSITFEDAEPTDLPAVAVPRSKRFRELAVRWRAAQGVSKAGILILTVDRAGAVEGFPRENPM